MLEPTVAVDIKNGLTSDSGEIEWQLSRPNQTMAITGITILMRIPVAALQQGIPFHLRPRPIRGGASMSVAWTA